MRIGDVRPTCNLVNASRVLQRDGIANVGEFAILWEVNRSALSFLVMLSNSRACSLTEDQEVMLLAECRQLINELLRKIFDNVNVRLSW